MVVVTGFSMAGCSNPSSSDGGGGTGGSNNSGSGKRIEITDISDEMWGKYSIMIGGAFIDLVPTGTQADHLTIKSVKVADAYMQDGSTQTGKKLSAALWDWHTLR